MLKRAGRSEGYGRVRAGRWEEHDGAARVTFRLVAGAAGFGVVARGYGPAGGRRARSTGRGTSCGGRASSAGARGAKAPRPRRHESDTGAIYRLGVKQPGRLPALAAGGRVTVVLAGRRVTCRGALWPGTPRAGRP